MFEHIDVAQGSAEWLSARLGKWTASNFSNLITSTGKESTSAKRINDSLVAELLLDKPADNFQSDAMLRGTEMETEAMDFLNFATGFNFKACGFLLSNDGYGCSPDGLDFKRMIGAEIKCPLAHTHVRYLLNNRVPPIYYAQIQGSMLVSGFKSWAFCSYHPEIKSLILEVRRDEKFIALLKGFLHKNTKKVAEDFERIQVIIDDDFRLEGKSI